MSLAPETRDSITSAPAGTGPPAAEAWAAGRGWEQSAGVEAHCGSQGGVAEGNPDVDPNDALGSVRVHTCVWELFMLF